MKIGLERQNTLMIWPSAIGPRSTSIGAPAAMVEASGFIWAIIGTATAAAPTAPTAPVAMYRKSRRVGSAEIAVTVFKSLFGRSALPRGIPQTHASRWRLSRPHLVLGEDEKR